MTPDLTMKDSWARFDRGDPLGTAEIRQMVRDGRAAEKFLSERGETGGVLFKLRLDLSQLEGYLNARR